MSLNLVFPINHPERDKSLHETLEAPTCDVEGLLTGPISLRSLPQVDNEFSPTPGDPYSVSTRDGVEYVPSAALLMQSRLYEAAHNMGLLHVDGIVSAIDDEIITQHERRCRTNTDAHARLLEQLNETNTKTVPQLIANLFWRYRTGYAMPSEGAEMLMRYPVMGGVEAAKRTQPFDFESLKQLDAYAYRELLMVRQNMLKQGIDAKIILSAGADTNQKYILKTQLVDHEGASEICIIVAKQTAGEVRADSMSTIQLKKKVSYIGFPTDGADIPGDKNIMKMHGVPYDMRPIGGSYYWCTTDKDLMVGKSALQAANHPELEA